MNWAELTQVERDAAYNSAAAVPDVAELRQRRETASAAFRAAHPAGLDVAYGPLPRQKWDVFAAADRTAPCIVFIHGGFWQLNSREQFASVIEGLVGLGWSAALPSYRLAPDATMTEIVADIRLALDWLAAEGPAAGIAGPVLLTGWSAGAHLAALMLDHGVAVAGLGISGVYDLGRMRDTYVDDKLRLTEDEVARLSPLRLPPSPKRFDIAFGTAELPGMVVESEAFHAYRAASGAPGEFLPIAGANHFTILDSLRDPAGVLARRCRDLLSAGMQRERRR
jgi:acetyl esterase/lipase